MLYKLISTIFGCCCSNFCLGLLAAVGVVVASVCSHNYLWSKMNSGNKQNKPLRKKNQPEGKFYSLTKYTSQNVNFPSAGCFNYRFRQLDICHITCTLMLLLTYTTTVSDSHQLLLNFVLDWLTCSLVQTFLLKLVNAGGV